MLKEPKNPVFEETIMLFEVRHVNSGICPAFRKRNRLAFGERYDLVGISVDRSQFLEDTEEAASEP
jgi:hypothetical protein